MSLDLVRMRHPELDHADGLPVTTRQAFDDVWAAKGWELDPDSAAAGQPLEEMTVAQLRARADDLGVDLDAGAKKADIIAALAAQEG